MDLAPGYRELALPRAFGNQIQCLWVQVVPATAGTVTLVLPDACTDLIWQSGAGAFVPPLISLAWRRRPAMPTRRISRARASASRVFRPLR